MEEELEAAMKNATMVDDLDEPNVISANRITQIPSQQIADPNKEAQRYQFYADMMRATRLLHLVLTHLYLLFVNRTI